MNTSNRFARIKEYVTVDKSNDLVDAEITQKTVLGVSCSWFGVGPFVGQQAEV